MKKWILSLIGGAVIGGAAGMYAGSRIMYNKCHESMMEVEEELNNLLFELKSKENEIEQEVDVNPQEGSEFVVPESYIRAVEHAATETHTPAYKSVIVEQDDNDKISVVEFDDFETIPEYESDVLFFYPDTGDVLDDQHQPISKTKVKEMIGDDALTRFDEYEEDPDCVRVKNDTLKTYYEILRCYTSP